MPVMLWYCVPYVFLSMLIEWLNCPTGLVWVELPLALLPLAVLAGPAGRTRNKKRLLLGNLAHFLVSGALTALLCGPGLPFNRCGSDWFYYFKPFNAIQMFLVAEVFLFLLQWAVYFASWPEEEPPATGD